MDSMIIGAFDAAVRALQQAEDEAGGPDEMTTGEACATVIEAFLRALPEKVTANNTHLEIADAVRDAAQ